jgi:hypothetical protein
LAHSGSCWFDPHCALREPRQQAGSIGTVPNQSQKQKKLAENGWLILWHKIASVQNAADNQAHSSNL